MTEWDITDNAKYWKIDMPRYQLESVLQWLLKNSALSHVVSYKFCWIQHWPKWTKAVSGSRTSTGLFL